LEELGVCGKELRWFSSYLKDREQFVEVDHIAESCRALYIEKFRSRCQTLRYGVPQGSILGPLLFLCYIRGMPQMVPGPGGSMCLYADDCNILFSGKSKDYIEESLNEKIRFTQEFLDQKNLLVNKNKTNLISFSTKQSKFKFEPSIFLKSDRIDQVDQTKFLGLIVDENLSWDDHINYVVKKLSSGIYALRQMSRVCDLETLKIIYYSLIQSHISYGISIYGGTTKTNLDKILIQQKRAIRTIMKLQKTTSVKNFFHELGILTVYNLLEAFRGQSPYNFQKINHLVFL
jgi:hypothetical protein